MPIHDRSYRRYGGGRVVRGRAWTVIATAGIRTLFGRRAFLGLLLLSWSQFFVRAVQIYAAANLPQAAFFAPTPETFRRFFGIQELFVFVMTVYVGAGLIANDRRANALQIYLSKPLTRAEYIFGKLTILMALLLLITWVPAVLLLIVQILFAGNFTFVRSNVYLFPAITLFSFIDVATFSATMLALSSLSTSGRYVGVLFAGVVFFSRALFNVLRFVTGASTLSWISFTVNLDQIGDVIFRLPPQYDTPWPVSLLMIVGLLVASALVLDRRVRGVEIVA